MRIKTSLSGRHQRRVLSLIEPLEARIAPASVFNFTDADGDLYKVKLSGPGTAMVTQVDPDGDGMGAIDSILVMDTMSKSKLSIAVEGDGAVSIGSIIGSDLGQIIAKKSDLVGTGVMLSGGVKKLVFHDLLPGAAIVAGGKIGSLVFGNASHAVITAPSFGKLTVKGNFADSLLLAGATLGADRAPGGSGMDADSFAPGSIGHFTVKGDVSGSVVGAGLSSADATFKNADDQILGGTKSKIGSLKINGAASEDSFFAAGKFPKAVKIEGRKLKVDTDPRFRVVADTIAPEITVGLAQDTGVSHSDGITFDPSVAGTLTDESPIVSFRAGLDGTATPSFLDVLGSLEADHGFLFTAGQLDAMNGAPLADGTHTLHLQATDTAGNATNLDLVFTLDTTGPTFSLTPLDATQDVLPRELVFAIFDEAVAVGSLTATGFVPDTAGAITLDAQGAPIAGRIVLSVTGDRLTFVPEADLPGNTELVANLATEKVFDLAGNAAMPLPSRSTFQTVNSLGIPGTTVVGFVFDSAKDALGNNIPLAGATVRVANAPAIQTVTDANGRFELHDTPAGTLMIDVDGHTVPTAVGTFYPTVAELVSAAPGQINTFAANIFLPLAKTSDFVSINNAPGALTPVTNPGQLPGWQLMVPGGAVERRDGTMADQIQIAFVAPDRLPAPLPPGMNPSAVITIQTQGGADIFNQPVPLTAPNLEGLAPGEKTMLWDFDHARGFFVPVGLATVSADGLTVTTDPGSGVVRPGWHFILRLAAGDVFASDGSETKDDGRPLSDAQKEQLRKLRNDILLSLAKAALEAAGSVSPLGGLPGIAAQLGLGVAADSVGHARDANGADDPNSLADRIGMALDFDGKAALNAHITSETLLEGSDAARGLTAERYAQALKGDPAAIADFGKTGNVIEQVNKNISAVKELSKFANKLNNALGALSALDDFRRAYDQANRVKQILMDPPGDATGVMLAAIEEQQAIIEENLSVVAEAIGRSTEALFYGAQLSLLGPTLPMRADQLTPQQDAQIDGFANDYLSSLSKVGLAGGGVLQDELEAAGGAANKLQEIIAPPSENRVFYKLQMPDGSTVRGTAFGAEGFRFDFVPGSGTVTVLAADPIRGSVGSSTIDLPSLSTMSANLVTFKFPALTLYLTNAPDADGNGLADNIDDVVSAVSPSRATVIDLKAGIEPTAAGLVNLGPLGRAITSGDAVDVAPGPNVAYVATTFGKVQIVDVSRPTNPVIVGSANTLGVPEHIASHDARFAVTGNFGVKVFDATNPAVPINLFSLPNSSPAVALGTNHLLVVSGSTLQSFDLKTGALTGELPLAGTGNVQDIFLTDSTVFAVRGDAAGRTVTVDSASLSASGGLTALDSYQFTNTVAEQAATISGGDGVLFVSNITADASGQNPGFATLNAANPSDLQLIAGPTSQTVRDLVTDGSGHAFAISSNAAQPSVQIFDVSNPANTGQLSTTIGTLTQARGVTIAGGLGFAVVGNGGFTVIRVAAPDTGTQPPTISISGGAAPGSVLTEGQRIPVHIAATDDVQVARVELVLQGDNVIATDTSYPFDLDLVGPSGLADGQSLTLFARAFDTGGNVVTTTPIALTYAALPPHVISATPAPGAKTQLAVSTITLGFDEPLSRGNAAPEDFSLVGAGPDSLFGTADDIAVPVAGLRYNLAATQLTLSLPAPLDLGSYRLTAPASKVTDRGGNLLDGEFDGSFPSGDGAFGGDFVYSFNVAASVASIFPVPLFPTGQLPVSLTSGDFDADGHPDLVTADRSGSSASVLFGSGGGSFSAPITLPIAGEPTGVAAGDLDADGASDLIVTFTNFTNGPMIAIFISNGDGTFADPAIMNGPSASSFTPLVLKDFNGDQKLDLLVPGAEAALFLGNGAGGFGAPSNLNLGSSQAVVAGDLNGDGILDLFSGATRLGNGDGTFRAPVFNSIPSGYNVGQIADVTGDGNADIVLTYGNLRVGTLVVAPGNGDGTFGATVTMPLANTTDLILADINGDTRLDAIATGGATGVTVFTGIAGGFAPGIDYRAPVDAFNAVLGDWNTDGKLDLAVTDLGDAVALIFGRGDGTFAGTQTPREVQRNSNNAAVGDVNNDGIPDVVTADDSTFSFQGVKQTITLLLGSADGSFSKAMAIDLGSQADQVALGDLNGDGRLDVVASHAADNTVSVLLGNGDGTFSAPIDLAVTDGPRYLRLADVNGDSRLDIITAGGLNTFTPGKISILPGNGNGSFGTRSDLSIPDPINDLLIADVNGDGRPDLATAYLSSFSTDTGITILAGNSDGTFAAPVKTTIENLTAAALADVNDDNRVDLLTGRGGQQLAVQLNNGSGGFGPATTVTVASDPTRIVATRVNAGNTVDILVTGFSSVQFLSGNGDGTFAAPDASVFTSLLGIGDFDGNGSVDLVTSESQAIGIRLGNNDGTFGTPKGLGLGSQPAALAIGDINGDGRLDAVTANTTSISVLFGLPNGQFGAPIDYPAGTNPKDVKLADFNKDGLLDIIVANQQGGASLLLGMAGGNFAPAVTFDLGQFVAGAVGIAVGDVNGDGNLDFVTANRNNGNVTVRLGGGNGTFADPALFGIGGFPNDVSLGDIDGDGDLDIVTADGGSPAAVSILFNNGSGTFSAPTVLAEADFVQHAALGDIDGDGDLDLAITRVDNSGNGSISVRLNNGAGVFGTATIFTAPGFVPSFVRLADVTQDGILDLITTNTALNGFSVLVGTGTGVFEAPRHFAAPRPVSLQFADLNGDGKLDIIAVDGNIFIQAVLNAG